MIKHLEVKIYGKVQGVFFRSSAGRKAEELAVSGFAQNLLDGSVYVEAEGEEGNLKNFLEWCRIGPSGSEVQKIIYKFSDKLKNFKDFEIK
ncbi:MAG: hypothetical protein ACD_15C00151G0007 [uncultured bacterium]|nr:MAG: hypothetical protein ACD_15C00151G0007 [uncultured bacterium]